MATEAYYKTALSEELARRQRSNPAYSLRSFARHLDMQPGTLSAVLSGKRPLSFKAAATLPEKLAFSPAEKKRFLDSVYYHKVPTSIAQSVQTVDTAKVLQEELHFKIIAQWEHYAVLTLADTHGFKADTQWIAQRLGITDKQAKAALDHLMQAGLITIEPTGKVRLHQVNVWYGDTSSSALKQSHREALQMSLEKLESVPPLDRDFSSLTVAVNPQRLPEAKKLVREFQKRLSELMEDGPRTEVFQFCMQLYPLTLPTPIQTEKKS